MVDGFPEPFPDSLYSAWAHYPDTRINYSKFIPDPGGGDLGDWSPATDTGQETATSPALAGFSGIQIVWRGPADDQGIYQGSINPDNSEFQFARSIPRIGSINGPALISSDDGAKLLMVWRGVGNDQGIYISESLDGKIWSPQHIIPGIGTATRPALALFKGKLFMYWRGINDDQGIYAASSADGVNFAGNAPGTAQTVIPGKGTVALPAVAALGDTLYMVWPGIEFDFRLYFASSSDGWEWSHQISLYDTVSDNFQTGQGLPSTGASLVAFNDTLILMWSAETGLPGGDDGAGITETSIWWSIFNGIEWGAPQPFMVSTTNEVPALAVHSPFRPRRI